MREVRGGESGGRFRWGKTMEGPRPLPVGDACLFSLGEEVASIGLHGRRDVLLYLACFMSPCPPALFMLLAHGSISFLRLDNTLLFVDPTPN